MKVVAIVVLPIVSFVLTLVAMLAMTGNLSPEGIAKLAGRGPAPVQEAPEPKDDIVARADDLKKREQELNERQARIEKDEKRLTETQAQMEELRSALQQMLLQITQAAEESDATQSERLTSVAQSLGGMKPAQAAKALEGWTPEEGAELLRLIDERVRGKILDSMDPDKTAAFLQAMQEQK
ncbi:MAG: hypothetical protein WC655_01075 [Candidatus Hydrogenedentales bacterium]|jgi:flagellar motility protein MotE (MotC chaperone)